MFQIQVLKFLKSQYIPRVWYDKGQKKKKKVTYKISIFLGESYVWWRVELLVMFENMGLIVLLSPSCKNRYCLLLLSSSKSTQLPTCNP